MNSAYPFNTMSDLASATITTGTVPVTGISGTVPFTGIPYPNLTDVYTVSTGSTINTQFSGGDLRIEGDVVLKGKRLSEVLEKIEERLAILHPNEALEEQWENLKGLRKAYRELEAEILEKESMWKILKK